MVTMSTMEGKRNTKINTGGLITTMDSGGLHKRDTRTPAACPNCGANFHSDPGHNDLKQQLKKRRMLHKCSYCDEYFSTLPNVRINVDKKTGKKIGPRFFSVKLKATNYLEKKESLFQCLVCNKMFATLSERNTHLATHAGVDTHMCTLCGFVSHEKATVEAHIVTHMGGNFYECPVCCLVFVSATQLDQHLTKHLGDTLHRCTQCRFVSAAKSAMQTQMMSLTLVQSEAQRHEGTGVITQDINIRITFSCPPQNNQPATVVFNNNQSDEAGSSLLHLADAPELHRVKTEGESFHLDDTNIQDPEIGITYSCPPQNNQPTTMLDDNDQNDEGETSLLHLPDAPGPHRVKTEGESSLLHLSDAPRPQKVNTEGKSALLHLSDAPGLQTLKTESTVNTTKSAVIDDTDVQDAETGSGNEDDDWDIQDAETSSGSEDDSHSDGNEEALGAGGGKAKVIKSYYAEIYNCPFCSSTFGHESWLKKHLVCHKKCALCATMFSSPSQLEEHIQTHTVGKEYRCLVCRKWFSDLLTHMMTHPEECMYRHGSKEGTDSQQQDTGDKPAESFVSAKDNTESEKPHKCTECGKGFMKKMHLGNHMKTHRSEKPYSCFLCGKVYRGFNDLCRHIKLHTGKKQYQCSYCGKQFAQSQNLNEHVVQHHTDERPHQCSQCDKKFSTLRILKVHIGDNHSKEKSLECSECHKWFKNKSSLKAHRNIIHVERDHTCSHCGKKLSSAQALKNHEMVHTGEKPFPCSMCSKQFRGKGSLKGHMQTHTGKKPHVCSVCGKRYFSVTALNNHIVIHAEEKRYECSDCGKRFHHACNLKLHMRTHTGEKPYLCTECGRSFSSQTHLKRHSHTQKRRGRKKMKTDCEELTETAVLVSQTAGAASETAAAVSSLNQPFIPVYVGGAPEPYSLISVEVISDV